MTVQARWRHSLLAYRQGGSAGFINDHLVRCIVWAARGDESKVPGLIALGRRDYRDLIMASEYDEFNRQIRDLSVSFLFDSPEKFWALTVAGTMAARGYRLISLETSLATGGPYGHIAEIAEGRATFVGAKGELRIEKKDRKWSIDGKRRDLEIHGLDHAFSDEQAFRDALSGYLLSNVRARAVEQRNEAQPDQAPGRSWWRFWR